MNNKHAENHFLISLELLHLLKWLLENDPAILKTLITHALENGLYENIKNKHSLTDQHTSEELQNHVVEFFSLLEALLLESVYEDEAQQTLQRTLIPSIKCIDTHTCDQMSIASSIAKATNSYPHKSKEALKEIMCKELLKRWKPHKKFAAH